MLIALSTFYKNRYISFTHLLIDQLEVPNFTHGHVPFENLHSVSLKCIALLILQFTMQTSAFICYKKIKSVAYTPLNCS